MEVTQTTASFSEFATLRGFKKSYVTELKAAGRLVLTDDGKRVRVAESIQRLADTKDPSKAGVVRRHEAERAAKAGDATPIAHPPKVETQEPVVPSVESETSQYQDSRAKREYYLAAQAELEFKKAQGELMVAADVINVITTAVGNLRGALENLPAKLAAQVAPITDEKKCLSLMTDAIEKALGDVSKSFSKLGYRP